MQQYRAGYKDAVLPGVANGSVWRLPMPNPDVKAYTLYNASVSYTGIKNMGLTFGIKNLLDKDPPFSAAYDGNTGAGSSVGAACGRPARPRLHVPDRLQFFLNPRRRFRQACRGRLGRGGAARRPCCSGGPAAEAPAPPARRHRRAVQPSTLASDAQIDKAVANVESLGLRVRLPENARARHGKTAGTVAQRLADFHAPWRDDEVKALWAVRGGSGAAALLPHIDLAMVRERPKAVIGYSDITALLLGLWRGAGLVGFHGPVATSTFSDYSLAQWRKVLMDPQRETRLAMAEENLQRAETAPQFRPRTLRGGAAEGRLVGGNLSVLTALVGHTTRPTSSVRSCSWKRSAKSPTVSTAC